MAEASSERLRRLLTLVPWLAAHSGVSKSLAAQHFGLTVAQLEADLALITVTGPGLYGGELVDIFFDDETITVADAQGLLQPMQLTHDEAATLLLGLRALQQLPDTDAGTVAGLMEKLGATTPDAMSVEVRPSRFSAVIAAALRDGADLALEYVHPVRDDMSSRIVTPRSIVTRDGVDYLTAYCHTAEAVRTFRVDRVHACHAVPRTHPTPTLAADEAQRQVAAVRLRTAHEHLLESVHGEVVERDGTTCLAHVPFSDERWLVAWILSMGTRVSLVDPRPLAEAVRAHAERALHAYAAMG